MMTITGDLELQAKLNRLSDVMQKKLVAKLSEAVVEQSKQRINDQIDLDGVAFAARKSKTNTKKMLLGLRDRLQVLSLSENGAVIGFSGGAGGIASTHQYGKTLTFKVSKPSIEAKQRPATLKQAKQLLDLGFRVKKQKPTIAYITAHYTIASAGFVLRLLREQQGITTKKSWSIVIPARSFLGITDNDKQALQQLLIDHLTTEIANG